MEKIVQKAHKNGFIEIGLLLILSDPKLKNIWLNGLILAYIVKTQPRNSFLKSSISFASILLLLYLKNDIYVDLRAIPDVRSFYSSTLTFSVYLWMEEIAFLFKRTKCELFFISKFFAGVLALNLNEGHIWVCSLVGWHVVALLCVIHVQYTITKFLNWKHGLGNTEISSESAENADELYDLKSNGNSLKSMETDKKVKEMTQKIQSCKNYMIVALFGIKLLVEISFLLIMPFYKKRIFKLVAEHTLLVVKIFIGVAITIAGSYKLVKIHVLEHTHIRKIYHFLTLLIFSNIITSAYKLIIFGFCGMLMAFSVIEMLRVAC